MAEDVRGAARTGVFTYRESGGRVTLIHTEVPTELRRRGIADALARAALDDTRQRGLRVRPLYPFAQAFMKRHPEYADLADPAAPAGGSR
jgi:predicted GNAT family acetyltransferase